MTIAESIRSAALAYPLWYFGVVESRILDVAFISLTDWGEWADVSIGGVHWRTYALLVAEALE